MTKIQITGAALAVLMAASLSACKNGEAAKPVDAASIADAIKADEAQLLKDFNGRDAAKVAGHDAPDVVQMVHGAANLVGPAADEASDKQSFIDDPGQNFSVSNESVDVPASGDMAVYRSNYVYKFADPKTKKPVTEVGNYIAGYKLQSDGSWKITWSVLSDTPATPATPPAPAEPAKS